MGAEPMGANSSFRFAVIADAHYHRLDADFDFEGFSVGSRRLVMRPLGDVARAPRVFNEAEAALTHVLDQLVDEGIRDVILLGDYTDDGQVETMWRLESLLDGYRSRGLRFHAVPGNHDIFGDNGRHRRKRFLRNDGSLMLVTSDPDFEPERGAGRIVSERMYCGGYPENLPRDCGYFGTPDALHWETPYGLDPSPEARTTEIRSDDGQTARQLMDASYLVEPHPGVWWLMIDANVFVPSESGEDGLADSTGAGWAAILKHRRSLLDWIADVARRAQQLEKTLLAFSHYPALDPLDGTVEAERAMMAPTSFHARIPPVDVAQALHATGIRLHFSGHVHVNDTAAWDAPDGSRLVNVAVPALVSFPAAFKRVTVTGEAVRIETVALDRMPLDPELMAAYEQEHALTGVDTGAMRQADDYGTFLSAHLDHLVGRRFLKREWPADIAALFRSSHLDELIRLACYAPQPYFPESAKHIDGLTLLGDWYRFRNGSDLANCRVPAARLLIYRILDGVVADESVTDETAQRLRLFFATFSRHLASAARGDITVDAITGHVIPGAGGTG